MSFVRVFSAACVASALGLLSLLALMLVKGNVSFQVMFPYAGLIGATVGGLLYLGVDAILTFGRGKPGKPSENLVLVRNTEGKVVSINGGGQSRVVRVSPVLREGLALKRKHLEVAKTLKVLKAAILVAAFLEAYFSLALLCGTFTPLMVVPSGSMVPTLNVGDLILVRGVDVRTISRGDVIVFNVPAPYDGHTPSPIVHRVIDVKADGGEVYFVTKGDNNPSADTWAVPAGNVIGKYAGRVPYMGLPVLFLKTPYGLAVVAALMLLWIFYPHRKRVGGGKVSVR